MKIQFQTFYLGGPGTEHANHMHNIMRARHGQSQEQGFELFKNTIIEFIFNKFKNDQEQAFDACAAKLCPEIQGSAEVRLLSKYHTIEDALVEFAKQEYPKAYYWLAKRLNIKTDEEPIRAPYDHAEETTAKQFAEGILPATTNQPQESNQTFQFPDDLIDDSTIIYTNGERTDQNGKKINGQKVCDLERGKYYSIIDRETGRVLYRHAQYESKEKEAGKTCFRFTNLEKDDYSGYSHLIFRELKELDTEEYETESGREHLTFCNGYEIVNSGQPLSFCSGDESNYDDACDIFDEALDKGELPLLRVSIFQDGKSKGRFTDYLYDFYLTDEGNIVFYFDGGNCVDVSSEGYVVILEPVELIEESPVPDIEYFRRLSKKDS